jgi:hypothetical protein
VKREIKRGIAAKPNAVAKTRIVFDVETEQFTQDFRDAKDIKTRLARAPKMRLACAFDGVRWIYFQPPEVPKLSALLATADVFELRAGHFCSSARCRSAVRAFQ